MGPDINKGRLIKNNSFVIIKELKKQQWRWVRRPFVMSREAFVMKGRECFFGGVATESKVKF